MNPYSITLNSPHHGQDTIRSVSKNLLIVATDSSLILPSLPAKTRYTYIAIYGAGSKASWVQFVVGNTELPMTQTVEWSKELLLEAIRYYSQEKGLGQIVNVRNNGTGTTIFQDESTYFEDYTEHDLNDVFPPTGIDDFTDEEKAELWKWAEQMKREGDFGYERN